MAGDENTENIVASGAKGQIEYAIDEHGNCEAKTWLESQSDGTKASFDMLFKKLATEGFIRNKTQFRKYKNLDCVFEFKRGGNRLFCRQYGSRWLLTHHYGKGGGSQTGSAKRTITISDKFIQRERDNIKKRGAT